jgi:hypothetical protein
MPRTQSGLITPPPTLTAAVRRLYAREGLAGTCRLLRLSRQTVDRLRGGVPVHVGTLLVAREALAPIDPAVQK